MLVDILLVFDESVLHPLLQIISPGTQLLQTINHVLHQMKPGQFVPYSHVKSGRDRALLLITPDVQVPVGPRIGQSVHQPWVSVETEDDVRVLIAQPVNFYLSYCCLHLLRKRVSGSNEIPCTAPYLHPDNCMDYLLSLMRLIFPNLLLCLEPVLIRVTFATALLLVQLIGPLGDLRC
jgi:hypothetical protein